MWPCLTCEVIRGYQSDAQSLLPARRQFESVFIRRSSEGKSVSRSVKDERTISAEDSLACSVRILV